jgi:hypothetical protein
VRAVKLGAKLANPAIIVDTLSNAETSAGMMCGDKLIIPQSALGVSHFGESRE